MLPSKRVVVNVGGIFRAALIHPHGSSPPSSFTPTRHVSGVQNHHLLFHKVSTEHGNEIPEQFSDEEQQGADHGSVPTPSLKKAINTRDMFFARAKETEKRLSHDSGDPSKAEDQEGKPSKDRSGSTTGTSH